MSNNTKYSENQLNENKKQLPFLGSDNNVLFITIALLILLYIINKFTALAFAYSVRNGTKIILPDFSFLSLVPKDFRLNNEYWRLFSFNFSHSKFLPLITNIAWLYFFGKQFIEYLENKRFLVLYILGGLIAGVLYLLSVQNLYEGLSFEGANAGIIAIAASVSLCLPDIKFFRNIGKGIPIYIFLILFILANLIPILFSKQYENLSIIIGGLLTGFIFKFLWNKKIDITKPFFTAYEKFCSLFKPKFITNETERKKMFYKTEIPPFKKTINVTQEKIDEILDKISLHNSTEFLTPEELDILERAKTKL